MKCKAVKLSKPNGIKEFNDLVKDKNINRVETINSNDKTVIVYWIE